MADARSQITALPQAAERTATAGARFEQQAATANARPRRRPRLNPRVLAYGMGPAALLVLLVLRRYGMVAHEPVWLWLIVFAAVPATSASMELAYERQPDTLHRHARVASHAAAVTAVIYLSGWGPVLTGAYAFVALENLAKHGSKIWRVTALWSTVGIAVGQLMLWQGVVPSFLAVSRAQALALMGTFVLLFIIRMAGATTALKEEAETSLRVSEDRFRSLVQNSSDTTIVIGPGVTITYVSPAVQQLVGRTPEELIGTRATDLVHPDDQELVEAQLRSLLQAKTVTDPLQMRMAHADGSWRDVEAVVANQTDRPSVGGYVANLRDITDRKVAEAKLEHQALHDPLTGLPNRTLIIDRAEQMLARARRNQHEAAALFVDLDNFKDINDTLGHEAGDRILQAVAERFQGLLRGSDTVGRLGGDEFVVLAEGVVLAAGPELLAERIQHVLKQPFRVPGYEGSPLTVAASIGIAMGDRNSAQELLRDADIALYRAKASGKNCAALFEPDMKSAVLDRLGLTMDLRAALEADQFFLVYQPVFDLDNVTVCGVEALIRWRHPTRGVVSPTDFVPMLEETGMIVDVGRWVLQEACLQAATWQQRGYHLTMSVNVSARQLETDGFLHDVRTALMVSGVEPASLVIEITETAIIRDADAVRDRLHELKQLGVLVAIDDFGTGYSSLAYLRQFPVDALKIDRSFVAAMGESPESAALVHALVDLGRTLGLETLAEGIEDPAQLEALRNEHCLRGQGFLLSRPAEPEKLEKLLDAALPTRP
jgi:diguanylate cyclase (GGDEF)-like protein/PAS domain S-box-containing protein